MSLVVAYWHKEGLEIYRFENQKPVQEASGPWDQIKPVPGLFQKRVLIVGRELLLHIRKKYPPAPKEKLIKALTLEIGGLFPLAKPAFHCQIYESFPTHTTLDIWAWESGPYGRLKEIFPFHYVLPEDVCYPADIPEVKVFEYRGITNILAHSGRKFLDAVSYPEEDGRERKLERFLQALGRHREEIKRVKIYGNGPVSVPSSEIPVISREAPRDYPLCLDFLTGLNLKAYKEKKEFQVSLKVDFLCRLTLYLILGYGLVLYLVGQKYDQATEQLRQKIKGIDQKVSLVGPPGKGEDYSGLIKEINERLRSRASPLKVIDRIGKKLPAESSVIRLVLDENNLELTVSSKDPLSVLKAIGAGEGVRNVRLRGTPAKDKTTGVYRFVLTMELAR